MPDAEPAIRVHNLTKRYGERTVVDAVSFTVNRGETVALLGPNGAGKTTIIEILEGYRLPDGGESSVLGCDPWRDGVRLKPHLGVMLQESGLYPTITPRESLRLFAHFYANPHSVDQLLDLVGMQASAGTRYRRLSGGQKQRLALAMALLPRPQVLFLDEPTAGMDPQARRVTWDIVRGLQAEGLTIVLTTHYLEEAEQLAHRVAIVNDGRLIAFDTPRALMGGETFVRVRTAQTLDMGLLAQLSSALNVRAADGGYVLETRDAPALLVEVATTLRDMGVPATELRVGQGTLEEVFLQLTGKEFRE